MAHIKDKYFRYRTAEDQYHGAPYTGRSDTTKSTETIVLLSCGQPSPAAYHQLVRRRHAWTSLLYIHSGHGAGYEDSGWHTGHTYPASQRSTTWVSLLEAVNVHIERKRLPQRGAAVTCHIPDKFLRPPLSGHISNGRHTTTPSTTVCRRHGLSVAMLDEVWCLPDSSWLQLTYVLGCHAVLSAS
jgi:hypothetical protein